MVTKVLLCVTGSVAAIKTQQIVEELRREFEGDVEIKVAVTEKAKHFLPEEGINGVEVEINSLIFMEVGILKTLIALRVAGQNGKNLQLT